jgi:FkbM family methyltransferase
MINLPYSLRILKSKRKLLNFLYLAKNLRNPSFLGSVMFPNAKFSNEYPYEDLEIIRRFLTESHVSLEKKLVTRLLNKTTGTVKIDNSLFNIECLEDLYHVSLCYEQETLSFIEAAVKPGGVFVDVGANIGGYTVRLAKKSRVYAFEPHPLNYSLLRSNLKLNNLNEASAYNCAVSDTVGDAELYTSKFHGCHSIVNRQEEHVTVAVTTLDKILSDVKKVDVLKIDVEGAEPHVFRGAIKTCLKTRFVVFEGSTSSIKVFAEGFLTALGFRYVGKFDFNNIAYSSRHET